MMFNKLRGASSVGLLSLEVELIVVALAEHWEATEEDEQDEESLRSVGEEGGVGRFLLRLKDADSGQGGTNSSVSILE